MTRLTDGRRDFAEYTPTVDKPPYEGRPTDESTRRHRQLIGCVGGALPVLLVIISRMRHDNPADPWGVQTSISAYYYTGAVAAFVGMLVALAAFLVTYRGYQQDKYGWADRTAALIAAAAAILVAFFPTKAPTDLLVPPWWTERTRIIHYVSAATLFTMFAVFSLWLFRRTGSDETPSKDKRVRNLIYLGCGIVILASMAWAVVLGRNESASIFWPESVALGAFAVSWLTKGHVDDSVSDTARSMGKAVKGVVQGQPTASVGRTKR